MEHIDFIIAVESGTITEDEFLDNVQSFVDSNIWHSLQGSWQRSVYNWMENGIVTNVKNHCKLTT